MLATIATATMIFGSGALPGAPSECLNVDRGVAQCQLVGDTLNIAYAGGRTMSLRANWTRSGDVYTTTQLATIQTPEGPVELPVANGFVEVNCRDFAVTIEGSNGIPDPDDMLADYLGETTLDIDLPSVQVQAGFGWGDQLIDDGVPGPVHPCRGYFYFWFDQNNLSVSLDGLSVGVGAATEIVVLVDPSDPAFYLGGRNSLAEYVKGTGVGFSAFGNLRWRSTVPLWDGQQSVSGRAADGHLYSFVSGEIEPFPKFPITLDIEGDSLLGFGDLAEELQYPLAKEFLEARKSGTGGMFLLQRVRDWMDELTWALNLDNLGVSIGDVLNIELAKASMLVKDGVLMFTGCQGTPGACGAFANPPVGADEESDIAATILNGLDMFEITGAVQGYINLLSPSKDHNFGVRMMAKVGFGPCTTGDVWVKIDHTGISIDQDQSGMPPGCDFNAWVGGILETACGAGAESLAQCHDRVAVGCANLDTMERCDGCEASCAAKYTPGSFLYRSCVGVNCNFGCAIAEGFVDHVARPACDIGGAAVCTAAQTICAPYAPIGEDPPVSDPVVPTTPPSNDPPSGGSGGGGGADQPPVVPNYACKTIKTDARVYRLCEGAFTHAEAEAKCDGMGGGMIRWTATTKRDLRDHGLDGLFWMKAFTGGHTGAFRSNATMAWQGAGAGHGFACVLASPNAHDGASCWLAEGWDEGHYVLCDGLFTAGAAAHHCHRMGGHSAHVDSINEEGHARTLLVNNGLDAAWIGLKGVPGWDLHWFDHNHGHAAPTYLGLMTEQQRHAYPSYVERVTILPINGAWQVRDARDRDEAPLLCELRTEWRPYQQPTVAYGALQNAGVNSWDDRYGAATAAGDFDGDGFDDLAVGVPNDHVADGYDGEVRSGAVYVHYGSADGFDGRTAYLAGAAFSVEGFGRGLVAGDFDDDGADELVVASFAGTLLVFADEGAGLTKVATLSGPNGAMHQPVALGAEMAAGDLGGTAADDLVAVVPGVGVVIFTRTFAGYHRHDVDDVLNISRAAAVAIGDIDGDGHNDIAVGLEGGTDVTVLLTDEDAVVQHAFGASNFGFDFLVGSTATGASSAPAGAYELQGAAVAVADGRVFVAVGDGTSKQQVRVYAVEVYDPPNGIDVCGFTGCDTSDGWGSGSEEDDREVRFQTLKTLTLTQGRIANQFALSLTVMGDRIAVGAPESDWGKGKLAFWHTDDLTSAGAWRPNHGDNGRVGAAIAAGDFDGDGAIDIAGGAPGRMVEGVEAGVVYVRDGASGATTSLDQRD